MMEFSHTVSLKRISSCVRLDLVSSITCHKASGSHCMIRLMGHQRIINC